LRIHVWTAFSKFLDPPLICILYYVYVLFLNPPRPHFEGDTMCLTPSNTQSITCLNDPLQHTTTCTFLWPPSFNNFTSHNYCFGMTSYSLWRAATREYSRWHKLKHLHGVLSLNNYHLSHLRTDETFPTLCLISFSISSILSVLYMSILIFLYRYSIMFDTTCVSMALWLIRLTIKGKGSVINITRSWRFFFPFLMSILPFNLQ
jgi:hypothetical protein